MENRKFTDKEIMCVTNLNLSGQFLRAVAKMHAVGKKTTPAARKNRFLRAVGVEDILRWNSTLKHYKDRIDLQ